MADNNQDWHYARGDQRHGPVSAAELKQLATTGRLSPSDLVWKAEWPDWRRADSIKGLFPAASPASAPPLPPLGPRSEALQRATDTADQVSQKLWFLDLKFERFATPKLIGFVFASALICLVLTAGAAAIYALLNYPALQAAFIVVVDIILLSLLAIGFRVYLEVCLIAFRVTEHLSHLTYLQHLQKPERAEAAA